MEKRLIQEVSKLEKALDDASLVMFANFTGTNIMYHYSEILKDDADENTPIWHTDDRLRDLRKYLTVYKEYTELPARSRHTRNFKNKVVSNMTEILAAMTDMDEGRYKKAKSKLITDMEISHPKALQELERFRSESFKAYQRVASIDQKIADEVLEGVSAQV